MTAKVSWRLCKKSKDHRAVLTTNSADCTEEIDGRVIKTLLDYRRILFVGTFCIEPTAESLLEYIT